MCGIFECLVECGVGDYVCFGGVGVLFGWGDCVVVEDEVDCVE